MVGMNRMGLMEGKRNEWRVTEHLYYILKGGTLRTIRLSKNKKKISLKWKEKKRKKNLNENEEMINVCSENCLK